MIRIYEFDSVMDVITFFGPKDDAWMSASEFNQYLQSKGHRPLRSLAGRKSYCEKHNIKYEKRGREVYYSVHRDEANEGYKREIGITRPKLAIKTL